MKSAFAVNLATPDNTRNCAEPNATDAVHPLRKKPPKKPRALIIITAIQTTGLAINIGLKTDGASRKGSSAMLIDLEKINQLQAKRLLVVFL